MQMTIPRFDCLEQYRSIKTEILQAVQEVLESGCLILGPHVEAFERKMCRFLGIAGHGVGVGNGTDALAIALRAMGVGAGDEVITVANTAVATVSAIRMTGAIPVFCDINPHTLLMDVQDAEKRISARTKALLPVHLFGSAVDMITVMQVARRHGLYVIEDCAQSCGTLIHGQSTGTWGDVGCFSFYPTKNLAAYGDAGLCFTRDAALAQAMRQLRHYGCDVSLCAGREGVNSRLDELQAAILEVKLRHLPAYLLLRRGVAQAYLRQLLPEVSTPEIPEGVRHSYHLFVIRARHRQQLVARLNEAGIQCGIQYPVPIHLMPGYRFLGYAAGSLPETELAASQVLSLPCYPEMPTAALAKVSALVNEVTLGEVVV